VGAGLGGCGGEGGTDANGVDAGPAAAQEVRSEKKQETNPNVPDADYADLVAGNTGFGMQLYQRLSGAQANLFYSPLSISVALAMTWAGARGTSEAQLAKALQFTLPQSALHPAMNKLILQMAARNVLPHQTPEGTKAVRVNLTNALWAQTGYQFVPAYLDALAVSYDAGVKLLDFSSDPDAAGEVINLWVAQQTEDKIKDLIPPGSLSPVTRLVLTNTLYFYGSSGGSVGRDSFVGQSG
jgi:serpin B